MPIFHPKDLIFDAVQPEKFFGAMLMPLPLLMLLMGLALLLLWFTRWQKAVRRFYAELAVLLLFSLQPVADRLLRPIEAQYQTYRGNDPVSYIVVLGGAIPTIPIGRPARICSATACRA